MISSIRAYALGNDQVSLWLLKRRWHAETARILVALPVETIPEDPPIVLPPELGIALFDQEAQRVVGISGDEFLERWDAGEFRDWEDTPEGRKLSFLILLIPFGRRIT